MVYVLWFWLDPYNYEPGRAQADDALSEVAKQLLLASAEYGRIMACVLCC